MLPMYFHVISANELSAYSHWASIFKIPHLKDEIS